MALMPGAIWRPMPGSSTTRISAYDIFCMHTMVGSLDGTDNYFRTSAAGTNSHFGVGGDGTIYQWVDTAYRSGANFNGNYHIISAETADMGAPFGPWGGSDVPAWTDAQIAALGRIAAWVNATHGIPLTQISDSRPGRRGVAYHRLGVPGYMVAGGEQWSTKAYKACPGDRRISQVPALIQLALTGSEEFDMAVQDDIKDIVAALGAANASAQKLPVERTVLAVQWDIQAKLVKAVADLSAKIDALSAQVGAPGGSQVSVKAIADQLTVVPKP